MKRNFEWKRAALLCGCGVLLLGAAAGCGSKPAAAPQMSAAAAAPTPSPSPAPAAKPTKQKGEKKRTQEDSKGKQANMTEKLKKTWEKKGASAADADHMALLVKTKHIEAKWVAEQLDAGRKAADIESDIQAGKAPVKKKETGSNNKLPEAAPAS